MAVAACIIGVGVIAAQVHGSSHERASPTPPSTSPTFPASTTRAAPRTTVAPSTSTSTTTAAPIPAPSWFQPLTTGVADWSWASDDHGWALLREPCATAVCVTLRETFDGGHTWTSLPVPHALYYGAEYDPDAACARSACVSRVRFASSQLGWLYGPALFQTTDGGHTWTRVPSATVDDLEAANGVAIRTTTTDHDCGGGCAFHMDRMTLGTSTWQRLPTGAAYEFPSLILQGGEVYSIDIPNWAGAGESYLRRSGDEGTTWTPIDDPCPPGGYRTADASAAPGGVLAVLCLSIGEDSASVRVSTDYGRTFARRHAIPPVPLNTFGPIAATSAGTIAIGYSDRTKYGVLVTHDGGATWRATLAPSAAPTRATSYVPSVGWEDAQTVRASFNTDEIWTSRDAGNTWTENRVAP